MFKVIFLALIAIFRSPRQLALDSPSGTTNSTSCYNRLGGLIKIGCEIAGATATEQRPI